MAFFNREEHRRRRTSSNVQSAPSRTSWDPPPDYELYETIPVGVTTQQDAPTSTNVLSSQPVVDEDRTSQAIEERLSEVITLVDGDGYIESDRELMIDLPSALPVEAATVLNPGNTPRSLVRLPHTRATNSPRQQIQRQRQAQQTRSINILSKVSCYSNSVLPSSLPPLRIYIPTYPLLCLAAQYSSQSYLTPAPHGPPASRPVFIPASTTNNTKAMVLSTNCSDTSRTITFAIRGTSTFSLRDWSTNLANTPTSPRGFLDDEGNLCHAGFLRVARAMVRPIAMKLRALLQENPSRSACSLLITGHSAGGAVASLIYAHMLSQSASVESELTILTGCFKRVHCVTFGSPPVSLLPLEKPTGAGNEEKFRKCLFFGFVNEGDLVVRAEIAYIRSLVELLTRALPRTTAAAARKDPVNANSGQLNPNTHSPAEKCSTKLVKKFLISSMPQPPNSFSISPPAISNKPTWRLPPATLSNAGRLVLLRVPPLPSQSSSTTTTTTRAAYLRHEFETVTALTITDEQIRQVVFGDPPMHAMEVYRRRIEALSFKAVTGRT